MQHRHSLFTSFLYLFCIILSLSTCCFNSTSTYTHYSCTVRTSIVFVVCGMYWTAVSGGWMFHSALLLSHACVLLFTIHHYHSIGSFIFHHMLYPVPSSHRTVYSVQHTARYLQAHTNSTTQHVRTVLHRIWYIRDIANSGNIQCVALLCVCCVACKYTAGVHHTLYFTLTLTLILTNT